STRARHGYLELLDHDTPGTGPTLSIAHALDSDGVEEVRLTISRGVVAEALASGRTVITQSAQLDPRFEHRESVQRAQIDAVLCAPTGSDRPQGVLYLQGWSEPDSLSDDDRLLAELFCKHVTPLIDRLLARRRDVAARDATRAIRQRLHLDGVVG